MKRQPLLLSQHLSNQSRPARSKLVLAAGLLLAGSAAQAQLSPYFVRISERISYDSNVFRVADGERRDAISYTAVTLGLDQPIGRQRVYFSATANYTAYKNNDQLNGPGYNLLAGLNWEAASKLSGDLRANFYQQQANLADYGTLQNFNDKNQERAAVIDLRGQYGGTSILTAQAVANHTDIRYTSDAFATRERKSNMGGGGLIYRPNIDWSIGALLRFTRGEYPQGTVTPSGLVADEYTRRDADLTASYIASGISSFNGRLTHTKEEHEQLSSRDFSGLTGEISWIYKPTGKLEFGASLSRETGSGGYQSPILGSSSGSLLSSGGSSTSGSSTAGGTTTVGGATTVGSTASPTGGSGLTTTAVGGGYLNDARVSDRLRLESNWDVTAKVRFLGALAYSRDRYDSIFVLNNVGTLSTERGNTRGVSLAARFSATRVWTFECGAGYESRQAASFFGYTYDATTGYCSAALALQ